MKRGSYTREKRRDKTHFKAILLFLLSVLHANWALEITTQVLWASLLWQHEISGRVPILECSIRPNRLATDIQTPVNLLLKL